MKDETAVTVRLPFDARAYLIARAAQIATVQGGRISLNVAVLDLIRQAQQAEGRRAA